MKFLLCCFLLLNLSFVKSEEILKSWSDLEKRGNTFFKKKTNEPFTGILKNFYPDGQVQLIDNFKDFFTPLNKTYSAIMVSQTLPLYLNPHSNSHDKSNFKL